MRLYGFPSVRLFLEKGFRVLPTSFRDPKAVKNLVDYSLTFHSDRMLGHLCTVWHGLKPGDAVKNRALRTAEKKLGKITAPAR
jgi:hypothetical protein